MSWLFPSRAEPIPPVAPPPVPVFVEWSHAATPSIDARAAQIDLAISIRDQAEDEYCLACDAYRALTVVLSQ